MTEALLGLDIGGSSSRARLRIGGQVVDATGPGANIATLDADVVEQRLTELLGALGNVHPAACCAGAAGAEVSGPRSRLRALIERLYPGCRAQVVHDTRLVLAAAGIDAGIALIAGTGSVAYARSADGREAWRGGWGWMLGDEGSGVWITREAARAVMRRAEAGSDIGTLGRSLLSACQANDPTQMIAVLHGMHEAAQWASLAHVIFETADDDPASAGVVESAASELSQLVEPLRSMCPDGPVVLAGGLLLHEGRLAEAVRNSAGVRCVRLEQPPVEGAVRLAEGLLVG